MSILKTTEVKEYKLAYLCGLALSGVEDGKPQWIGTKEQFQNYFNLLTVKN